MQTRSKSFGNIQGEIEKFVAAIMDGPRQLDLQPIFFRLTMDTTMAVLFGKSLESTEAQGASETAFAQAFDHAQHQLARRGRLGDFYWLLGGRDFRHSCNMVHKFVDKIVSNALVESKKEAQNPDDRYIFLNQLISHTRDPTVLRDQLINVLLAGRDTTVSWDFRRGCFLKLYMNSRLDSDRQSCCHYVI